MGAFKTAFPVLVVALFASFSGTFYGGALLGPSVCGWLALLVLAAFGASRWRDPWALGRAGALVWVLWLALALSLILSPVPRAGSTGVLLLPLYLLLPAGIARCWSSETSRRRGMLALAWVFVLVCGWALTDWALGLSERAAMPLGHHNLLAFWLVMVWPLAAFGVGATRRALVGAGGIDADSEGQALGKRRTSLRALFASHWLSVLCGVVGMATLVATRSLAGAVALAVQLGALGIWGARSACRRHRFSKRAKALSKLGTLAALLVPLLVLGLQADRVRQIVERQDSSAEARLAYATAGWSGFLERPLTGWGPGSSSWLLAEHLPPRAGVLPRHQVVSDVHALPLEILFELGAVGALLGCLVASLLVVAVVRTRLEAKIQSRLLCAAISSFSGAAVFALVGGVFDVAALWVALCLPLGCWIAVRKDNSGKGMAQLDVAKGEVVMVVLLLLVLLASLSPRALAQWRYERFVELVEAAERSGDDRPARWSRNSSSSARATRQIERAVDLDPSFPLYRHLWAGTLNESERAFQLGRAAAAARGLAPLWLSAGESSADVGSRAALLIACDLDPLSGLAPFLWLERVAKERPGSSREPWGDRLVARASRALMLEPRLVGAALWHDHPELLAAATDRLVAESSLDAGWRVAADRELRRAETSHAAAAVDLALVLGVDLESDVSLSLFAFRRRPLARTLLRVELPFLPPDFDLPSGVAVPRFDDGLLTSNCGLR